MKNFIGKILIIEDEKPISDIIKFNLVQNNFDVICEYNGEDGYNTFMASSDVDLILLDMMMPKMNGLEVCTKIRKSSNIPIIMLTAKADENDKVLGLESGADDYVTKPFSNKELIARIKTNLRRTQETQEDKLDEKLIIGDLTIDQNKYEIYKRNVDLKLSKREYELVLFLAKHKDKAFTREELLEKVWGYEYFGDSRTVDVTVRRLRTKIEDNSDSPTYIVTKRNVGYYFGG
ncbi:MAG: response regulator [Lachnospirales bacterium]